MQIKRTLWFLTAGALLLMLTACPGPAPTTGTLEITVAAPAGVTPDVRVTGPSTDRPVSTTGATVLADLQPGEYQVVVNQVVVAGIGYGGTGATLRVEAGRRATHNVNYLAVSGAIRIDLTDTGLPTGLSPEVTLVNPDRTVRPPTSSTATELDFHNLPPGNYTLEVPNRTLNGLIYASAQDGATVTVTAGEQAAVNLAYTLNPGAATITVAGLVSTLPSEVTVTLTRGTDPITRTFSANGNVNFDNLPPGTYTITANAIVDIGDYDYAFTLSPSTLSVVSNSTSSATLTYSRPTLSVTLSGLPQIGTADTLTVAAQRGTEPAVTQTFSNHTLPFSGAVSLTLPRFGSYTVSAYGSLSGQPVRVVGQIVDSLLTSDTPTASVSSTASSATATLTFGDGLTGRLFVAGNGAFNNGIPGEDAAYTITDFELTQTTPSLTPLTGPGGLSAPGLFRVAFDAQGNLFAMYQFIPPTVSEQRIVRISAANLAAGNFGETASGNTVIDRLAMGPGSEPADMAFDRDGNLWIANDAEGRLVCIAAARLTGSSPITSADATFNSNVQVRLQHTPTPEHPNPYTVMDNIRTIAFDTASNLWFAAGDYRVDRVTGTAQNQTVEYGRRAVLARINAAALTCAGGTQTLTAAEIPVRLDISNARRYFVSLSGTPEPVDPEGPYRGILKPAALVYDPATNSLWVGDYGGSNGLARTNPDFRDADADQETLIRVPLNATNTVPTVTADPPDGFNLRPAAIDHRISIGFTESPGGSSTGLQQVFGLAFDKTGALWIVANNNVELVAGDVPGPSDRRGKLYRVTVPDRTPAMAMWAVQNVTPIHTINAPNDGVGFAGIGFNR
jgi:hypothetical protein